MYETLHGILERVTDQVEYDLFLHDISLTQTTPG